MLTKIPQKYRPLVLAVALIAAAGLVSFTVDLFDISEPVADCCATDFDPTPYEQVPARTAP